MYKLFVTDLDGTFLDDEKEIPEINIEWVERLHEDFGIIPMIATARPLEVAKYIADKAGDSFQSYIIATNGAILWDVQAQKYLINEALSEAQMSSLVEMCQKNGLEYEFMTTRCEVADAKYSYRRVVDPMYDNMGVPFNYQEDLAGYLANLTDPVPLFAVNGTEEELEKCDEELRSINGLQISGKCIRTTPEKEGKIETLAYYDIMKEGVTKAKAIETLTRHLGIEKEEVIAIGDGGNDIEMLEMAGLKIAMRNATEALKAKANIITSHDNNHGGVGFVLRDLHKTLTKRKREAEERSKRLKSLEGQEPDI